MPYELIVSSSAVVIALCALLLSLHQGLVTRRFNKLSVRPKLHFRTENIGQNEKFQLFLANNGIGPAILKETKVSYIGKEIKGNDPLLNFLALIKASEIVGGGEKFTAYTSFHIGDYTVLPGKELLLLEVGRNELLHDQELKSIRSKLIPELNKLNIEIKYQSLYGDEDSSFKESLK